MNVFIKKESVTIFSEGFYRLFIVNVTLYGCIFIYLKALVTVTVLVEESGEHSKTEVSTPVIPVQLTEFPPNLIYEGIMT